MNIKKLLTYFPRIIYSILRYHNILGNKYKISQDLSFGYQENILFEKLLGQSNFYLEYGSGSSSILAARKKKDFLSIECDRGFYLFIRKFSKNIKFKNIGYTDYYGHPISAYEPIIFNLRKYFISNKAKKMCYEPLIYLNKNRIIPDLILIDGRYRVLCALYLYRFLINKKNHNFNLIIDDYKYRYRYHILNKFFKIELVGRFGFSNKILSVDIREVKYWIDHFSYIPR